MTQAEAPFTPPKQPLGLNQELADFELATLDGVAHRARAHVGKILVIDFWSAECPISRQYDAYFNGFAQSYGHKGVVFLAIDSNVYEDEDDIQRAIEDRGIEFPILRDTGNRIADYFGAQTTPHVYVFDGAGRLRYRGAVDDITFKNKEATINYLEEAVDALLLGNDVTISETQPYGCTIVRAWNE